MPPLTFISFFAGIGGIDLGLERAGHRCVGQVEIDDYCTKVLEKHWPDVPRWRDIRELQGDELPQADLWTAGFPCQDLSNAGKRKGIRGERSGLFFELARLVRKVRPRYVLLENVPGLLARGMGAVLGELAESGHDAEWDCIPAAAVGAPYWRDSVFVVAQNHRQHGRAWRVRGFAWLASGLSVSRPTIPSTHDAPIVGRGHWANEPGLVRLVRGLSPAVDRLRCLGNAVVPQVAEYIGRLLMEMEGTDAPAET